MGAHIAHILHTLCVRPLWGPLLNMGQRNISAANICKANISKQGKNILRSNMGAQYWLQANMEVFQAYMRNICAQHICVAYMRSARKSHTYTLRTQGICDLHEKSRYPGKYGQKAKTSQNRTDFGFAVPPHTDCFKNANLVCFLVLKSIANDKCRKKRPKKTFAAKWPNPTQSLTNNTKRPKAVHTRPKSEV